MSNIEVGLSIGFSLMLVVMAYRGIFGMFIWRWTRIPFAFLGGMLLSIAANGVPEMPVIRDEELEAEIAEHVETSDIENPTNDDDRAAKHVWSLKGYSPTDIKNQCVMQAATGASGNPEIDAENDEIFDFSNNPKEPLHVFQRRKQLQRA